MSLLLVMLPLYLLGNLHCLGMCGPLVLMIGAHRFRYFYFLGRLLSFTLAGTIAGAFGAVIQVFLEAYHIPAATSFLFGGIILTIGISTLQGRQYPAQQRIAQLLKPFNQTLSLLMLRDRAWPTFLFGFFTIALPCGQTLIVYSACALSGDPFTGTLNGFVFALLTTPSLWAAMHANTLFQRMKKHYNTFIGIGGVIIGALAVCRGLAQMDMIPHFILNSEDSLQSHIVIF